MHLDGFVLMNAMLFSYGFDLAPDMVIARPGSSPLFFATAVYSFEGIANMLPVENSLKDREQVWPLLYISMACVGFVYAAVGLLSYLAWPKVTAGSITAELAATRPGIITGLSSWMVIVAVIFTFPVQLFPAVELLELRLGFRESSLEAQHEGGFKRVKGDEASSSSDESDGDGNVVGGEEEEYYDDGTGGEVENPVSQKGLVDDPDELENGEFEDVSAEGGEPSGTGESKDDIEADGEADSGTSGAGKKKTKKHKGKKHEALPQGEDELGKVQDSTGTSGPLSLEMKTMANDVQSPFHDELGVDDVLDDDEMQDQRMNRERASTESTLDFHHLPMPLKQKVFRVFLVICTWLAAVLVPNLGALIALIGAISGSLLAIILPALINLRCDRPDHTREEQLIDMFLIGFGSVGGILGSALAISQALVGAEGLEA